MNVNDAMDDATLAKSSFCSGNGNLSIRPLEKKTELFYVHLESSIINFRDDWLSYSALHFILQSQFLILVVFSVCQALSVT